MFRVKRFEDMQKTDRYALLYSDEESYRSTLSFDRQALPTEFDGLFLEQQFALDDGKILLMLTDDYPYDGFLHIYLLDKNNQVEDSIEAGLTLVRSWLEIKDFGSNWIEFDFFSKDIYRLEVMEKSRLRFCFLLGWSYKSFMKTHRLVVRKVGKG